MEYIDPVLARLAALREAPPSPAEYNETRCAALLAASVPLENALRWAREMQTGAEGFDNSQSAREYADLVEQVSTALTAVADACEKLRAMR